MSQILIKFLEELGVFHLQLDRQKKAVADSIGSPEEIMKVISNSSSTPVTIDVFQEYLHLIGIISAKDELHHLFTTLDISQQGFIGLDSLQRVFGTYHTEPSQYSIDIQKQPNEVFQGFIRANLAGYRELRKIRRILLSYQGKSWGEWLSLIWSREQGRVSIEEVQLFLRSEYVEIHIIDSLRQYLGSLNIDELTENTLQRLVIPHDYPVTQSFRTNSGLRVQKMIRNIQRSKLIEYSKYYSIHHPRLQPSLSDSLPISTHYHKSQLKNISQLTFYMKLLSLAQNNEPSLPLKGRTTQANPQER